MAALPFVRNSNIHKWPDSKSGWREHSVLRLRAVKVPGVSHLVWEGPEKRPITDDTHPRPGDSSDESESASFFALVKWHFPVQY